MRMRMHGADALVQTQVRLRLFIGENDVGIDVKIGMFAACGIPAIQQALAATRNEGRFSSATSRDPFVFHGSYSFTVPRTSQILLRLCQAISAKMIPNRQKRIQAASAILTIAVRLTLAA